MQKSSRVTNSVARRICLQHARLVEVTSNIWGTKFKFHGLADSVPANLGQVTYRTSLLHLQPRQMTLVMTELRDDVPAGIFPRSRTEKKKKKEMQPLQFEELAPKRGTFRLTSFPRIVQRRRENKISLSKTNYIYTQVRDSSCNGCVEKFVDLETQSIRLLLRSGSYLQSQSVLRGRGGVVPGISSRLEDDVRGSTTSHSAHDAP